MLAMLLYGARNRPSECKCGRTFSLGQKSFIGHLGGRHAHEIPGVQSLPYEQLQPKLLVFSEVENETARSLLVLSSQL